MNINKSFLWISFSILLLIQIDWNEGKRFKRVIGGTVAQEDQWPWLVHLQANIPLIHMFGVPVLFQGYYCTASLINQRWVLTAAHCFSARSPPIEKEDPMYWQAKLGDVEASHSMTDSIKSFLSDFIDEPEWKKFQLQLEEIVIHPEYDETDDWKHDIALVKLSADLPLDHKDAYWYGLKQLSLPAHSEDGSWPRIRDNCIMAGWGCTENGGTVSNLARSVSLPILENEDCIFENISPTRLCAGYNSGYSGICPGDSGGPLVCKLHSGDDAEWIQAGIASYTSAFKPDSVPGVFTRLTYYTKWIQSVLGNNVTIVDIN